VEECKCPWPVVLGGALDVFVPPPSKKAEAPPPRRLRIERLQLEMDTGKSTRAAGNTLVDLNRAGSTLIEIVTMPDLRSAEEAPGTCCSQRHQPEYEPAILKVNAVRASYNGPRNNWVALGVGGGGRGGELPAGAAVPGGGGGQHGGGVTAGGRQRVGEENSGGGRGGGGHGRAVRGEEPELVPVHRACGRGLHSPTSQLNLNRFGLESFCVQFLTSYEPFIH